MHDRVESRGRRAQQAQLRPLSCGGTVTIHSGTGEITRINHCWAMNQFVRSIRRGARRFHSGAGPEAVSHVACQNPDGTRVVVLTNPGEERNVHLQFGEMTAAFKVAAGSITTAMRRY